MKMVGAYAGDVGKIEGSWEADMIDFNLLF